MQQWFWEFMGQTLVYLLLAQPAHIRLELHLRGERISRLVRLLKQAPGPSGGCAGCGCLAPAPFRDCFDAVVADVPCSGLGTLRRNPEIKWHFQPEGLASLQQTQERILHSVSEAVRTAAGCSIRPAPRNLKKTNRWWNPFLRNASRISAWAAAPSAGHMRPGRART